jgi:hypothetical protein
MEYETSDRPGTEAVGKTGKVTSAHVDKIEARSKLNKQNRYMNN